MTSIATLALNPAVDLSFSVDKLFPVHKMRGSEERHDPGGGAINVARVFVRLGGDARCYYLSGGAGGAALDALLDLHQLVRTRFAIAGETRISTTVLERASGQEYRFTTDGPEIRPEEANKLLTLIANARCDFFVASGSLPRGVADDFYADVASVATKRDVRLVLDSSGRGLTGGLSGKRIFLVKPSIGELRALTGLRLETDQAIAEAARALIDRGQAEHVAVTMGHLGAMLVNAEGVVRLPAVAVPVSSAVGAGDSFLATMVFALASGKTMAEAFRHGIAGGAASVLHPGTGLAQPTDIARLLGDGD